jgi:ubiquinone/menaquinone biosynthesis C-methylase UbiE
MIEGEPQGYSMPLADLRPKIDSFEKDKLTERDRYDARARNLLAVSDLTLGPDGAASQPLAIRQPYLVFEEFIRRSTGPGKSVLDVCCGTGLYSLVGSSVGALVTATDIAEHNLLLARRRAERAGLNIQTVVADAERLPFPDGSFDLISCAGSLSYLDLDSFLAEVHRLLRPGGWFVSVDSLNHNPIYRINRFCQYLKGRRTRSTLLRMPTLSTVGRLQSEFVNVETSYHGIASFLAPWLQAVVGETRAARLLNRFDEKALWFRRWAFKVVFRGRNSSA